MNSEMSDMTDGPFVAPLIQCDIGAGIRKLQDAENARVFQDLEELEDEGASASVRRARSHMSAQQKPAAAVSRW